MFADEHRASSLAKELLAFDYVIIDTCSLMDDNFPFFMDLLAHSKDYIDKNLPIYIPTQCIEEMKKHCKDKTDNSKRIAAKRGIKIFKMGRSKKILTLLKIDVPSEKSGTDQYENFADRAILVKITSDRLSNKIMVITQDKKLAGDLLRTNHLRSQFGRWLVVNKIAEGGILKANTGMDVRPLSKSSHFNRPAEKPVHKEQAKPQPKKEEPKPQPKKEERKPQPDFLAKVVASDASLAANLSNSTYSLERKVADIRAQLTELGKHRAADFKGVKLNFTQNQLEEKLKTLSADLKQVHIRKEEEKRENKAKQKEAGTKLWYGNGDTLAAAFLDCAGHYGYIVRDDGVPFNQAIHKADLTQKSISHVSEAFMERLKGETRESITIGSIHFMAQRVNGRFRAWIELIPEAPTSKPEPKKAEPKEPEPKKEEGKKGKAQPKKSSKSEKQENPAKEPKKPAESKKTAKKKDSSSNPKEPILIVAVPEDPREKEKIEKQVKKPVAEKKTEPKPAKKKPAKQASESKPAEPKKEEKPQAKKPEPEGKEPKKAEPQKKASTKKTDAFTRAQAAEKRLQANLPNPNYDKEDKLKDLQAQLELINSLPKEKRDELALQPEAIKALIAVMK